MPTEVISPEQREFFRKLCAPIPQEDIKKRKGTKGQWFSYITARTLYNRLDEVAGPTNWYPEFIPTARGFTCKLWINVPDNIDGVEGRRWMFKANGGGFAGMPESDNDEKSGYADAEKRAGVTWGIAREFYDDGVAEYEGDAPAAERPAPPPQRSQPAAPPQGQGSTGGYNRGSYQGGPNGNSNQGGGQGGNRQYDNFVLPKPGKAVFAWAMSQQREFGNGIVDMMRDIAASWGMGTQFNEWDEPTVNAVCVEAIANIKSWKSYKGQWDHLETPRGN